LYGFAASRITMRTSAGWRFSCTAVASAVGAISGGMLGFVTLGERRWEEFSRWAEQGERLRSELLFLVDEDTRAFDRIMAAMSLPKSTDEEAAARKAAITEATKGAIRAPLRTMQVCVESMGLMKAMAEKGLPASVSDAGVGALCARAGALGAYLNVRINCGGMDDAAFKTAVLQEADALKARAEAAEAEVMALTLAKV
ncbi:MAG: cyclodeaminase/cyclohydrolase family protein, partial [Flavobacteriales bacterium]